MLSIRLPKNLEEFLEIYAHRMGISKNAVIAQALGQFMDETAMATAPVAQSVAEERLEIFQKSQANHAQQWEKAREVADWIQRKTLWTKKLEPSGKATPGAYGRNIITGFTDSVNGRLGERRLYVIARNLATDSRWGTDRFYNYVMTHEDWIANMEELDILKD